MFATPNDTCGLVTTGPTALVALAFVVFQVQQKQWAGVGAFVVVLALLTACRQFGVCRCVGDLRVCLLLAVLAANVVALPARVGGCQRRRGDVHNPGGRRGGGDDRRSTWATPRRPPLPRSAHPPPMRPCRRPPATAPAEPADDADDPDDDDKEPNYVDTFSTFMETHVAGPRPNRDHDLDTKDLIATQKSLMETVKSLAPVITQGREMMDTFKDYFGPNSHKDLMKAFKGGSRCGGRSDKAKASARRPHIR